MAFPQLEVLTAPPKGPPELAVGARLEAPPSMVVGSEPSCQLVLPTPLVSRRHCRLEHKYERWWLLDLGSQQGTLHNGAPTVNVELLHRDTFAMGGYTFRFLTREPQSIEDPTIDARLLEAPDDLARWRVYADWLLERGDELGERVLHRQPADDGRWLGLLASAWARGFVEVDWVHGLPSRLVLRNPTQAPAPAELRGALEVLRDDPMFRFLRKLEVDLESLAVPRPEAFVADLLRPLSEASLPLLRAISLGPLHQTLEPAALAALERQLRPRRVEPFVWPAMLGLEVLSAPAAVEVTPPPGEWVALSTARTEVVGHIAESVVQLRGPAGHPALTTAVSLSAEGGWHVVDLLRREQLRAEFQLALNGRPTVEARLRPGDVLEVAHGLLLRFAGPPAG